MFPVLMRNSCITCMCTSNYFVKFAESGIGPFVLICLCRNGVGSSGCNLFGLKYFSSTELELGWVWLSQGSPWVLGWGSLQTWSLATEWKGSHCMQPFVCRVKVSQAATACPRKGVRDRPACSMQQSQIHSLMWSDRFEQRMTSVLILFWTAQWGACSERNSTSLTSRQLKLLLFLLQKATFVGVFGIINVRKMEHASEAVGSSSDF